MFFTAGHRNVGQLIDHLGDRPIDTHSTLDAGLFRDWLVERDLSPSSISRIFYTVRAVINLTIQENGLNCIDGFAKTFLPTNDKDKRLPIPQVELRNIQKTCLDMLNERRLLIALISDTGMRLSEALGLVWEDV